MSNEEAEFYSTPTLSTEDQILIEAYLAIGKPVDQLPYTKEFNELLSRLGRVDSDAQKYLTFQQLLALRKRGRLPRIIPGVGSY